MKKLKFKGLNYQRLGKVAFHNPTNYINKRPDRLPQATTRLCGASRVRKRAWKRVLASHDSYLK